VTRRINSIEKVVTFMKVLKKIIEKIILFKINMKAELNFISKAEILFTFYRNGKFWLVSDGNNRVQNTGYAAC
jgi:hypothetical protein